MTETGAGVVTIHASVTAREESVDAVHQACLSIVDDVVAEDGCLTYHLLRGAEDQRVFAWFEQWRDEGAFQAHLTGPPASRLGAALEGKLAGPMVIHRYDALR